MSKRVSSCNDIVELIDEWGFVPFFRNEIRGFSVEELTAPERWFSNILDGPWEWKGPAIRESGCAYGKFFCGKAVFISSKWYPDFANYRRDGYDFDALYDEGKASYKDKWVYDILEAHDSLISKELKRLGGFSRDGRKGFDTIITRLQMEGYVTTTNFEYQIDKTGKPYGMGLARYALPEKHFGEAFTHNVYRRKPEESRQLILHHLSDLLPHADEKLLQKFVG